MPIHGDEVGTAGAVGQFLLAVELARLAAVLAPLEQEPAVGTEPLLSLITPYVKAPTTNTPANASRGIAFLFAMPAPTRAP